MKTSEISAIVGFSICVAAMWPVDLVAEESAQIKHRFACVDNKLNQLLLVDQFDPGRSWATPVPKGSRDIQVLDDQRLLVSHGNGAREYDAATGKPLAWQVTGYSGIQTARRLANGNTLLLTARGAIYELDPDGKEVRKAQVQVERPNLRLVRLLDNGHLLIGAAGPRAVLEVSGQGELIRSLPLDGKGYTAVPMDNGHILAGTGEKVKIVEMVKTGKTVSYVGGKEDHPDLGLDFCSGWDLLHNGNVVMANWLGHVKPGKEPHLIEFAQGNKVVWKWDDHETAKQITNVKILK